MAHRNEDAALHVLRHVGEVQEGRQRAAELVVADVEDVHQDLAVRKLQRLLVEHAGLPKGRGQRARERVVADVHRAQRREEVGGVGGHSRVVAGQRATAQNNCSVRGA